MNEDEIQEVETRQKLHEIRLRMKENILQVYNEVMSCQCAHCMRLETAAFMAARAAFFHLTPAEKVLCALVVVLTALAVYVGYMLKMPDQECGCRTTEYF